MDDPTANSPPPLVYIADSNVTNIPILGVGIEGTNSLSTNSTTWTLQSVDPYIPSGYDRYIDVFTRNNGTTSYKISSNVSYVSFRSSSGTLNSSGTSDVRSTISVNWDSAPSGISYAGITVKGSSNTVNLVLPVHKNLVPSNFKGYIESAGAIAIEAQHFVTSGTTASASYKIVANLGRTLSGVILWPVTLPSQTTSTGPSLDYSLYTFSKDTKAVLTFYFGSNLNVLPDRPMKFAYAVDGNISSPIQPVPDTVLGTEPQGWTNAVNSDVWMSTATISIAPGSHTLSVWIFEPGLVLQKLALNVGGMQSSSLGPPESHSQ
jgi:hypothetical protein